MAKRRKSNFQILEHQYVRKTKSLFSTPEGKILLDTLANGKNSYLKFSRYESSSMDLVWVKKIIDCIPAIGDIVGNPKKTIQTLAEVVQVEKVKKIGVETVQHLSSHTQYIKTVDENGNVTPSKLLNIYNDDFYAIYENKFIATLLRHLLLFVEKRYELLKNSATMSNVNMLYAKNHTEIDDNIIDVETKVRYAHPADTEGKDRMRGFVKQVEDIRKYLKFYMHSEFMRVLRREKDVRNPILQTNIIRKNPKYHKCYLLWLYIERYRESGVELKVEENYSQLTPEEIQEINQVMAANFLLMKGQDIHRKTKKKIKVYKPKILNTYDDAIYKPAYFDGPVEYIRVDERYRNYTETLFDVDPHPTRAVAEYNIEKYRANKKNREKTKQIDALLARKQTEKANYESGEAKAEQREKDRDAYVDAVAEKEIREEAIARTEKVRKEVVNEAQKDQKKKLTLAKLSKEKPVEQPTVEEIQPAPVEPKPAKKAAKKKVVKKTVKKVAKKTEPKPEKVKKAAKKPTVTKKKTIKPVSAVKEEKPQEPVVPVVVPVPEVKIEQPKPAPVSKTEKYKKIGSFRNKKKAR